MSIPHGPVLSDKIDGGEKSSDATATSVAEYSLGFEQKTMRYVDWRIMPILCITYSIAIIDRINLGSAYTAGMGADLSLAEGGRYNLIVCIFFVPYTLLQLPGNLVLRKFGVRNWLTFTVISWGAVQLGMSFVRAWSSLVVCRFLLGVFEASLFPSLVFIMSTWYKRHEVQLRFAIFMLIPLLAAGLSPIFAYACSLLEGQGNLAGWRWIFVIEGLLTLLAGILTWLFIPDFPDQNRFLTSEQTALVLRRIDDDRGDANPDPLTAQKVRTHLSDWVLWAQGIILLCTVMPGYSQAYFLPIILKEMGWTDTQALLLSAAPSGVAVTALVIAYISDRYKHRSGFIALSVLISICGIAVLAFAQQRSVRYFGTFLIAGGSAGALPAVLAYAANNVVSHSKRSVQTAIQISFGGIGAILGTVVFRSKDAPRYTLGLATTLASQCVVLLVLFVITVHYVRQNKLMREGRKAKPLEGQPGFFYTL